MREFLKGLELDDETIDTIMAEHGKHLTKLQEQVSELRDKEQGYKSKIEELNSTIENNTNELKNFQDVTNENKDLKAQLQMSDSNVKKEFSKFVTSEIMSRVNDDNDFASVLKSYKEENPQYFGESVVHKVQTSPTLNGGTAQPQTTNSIMNDLLRSATNKNDE